jgi:hypothetical protein
MRIFPNRNLVLGLSFLNVAAAFSSNVANEISNTGRAVIQSTPPPPPTPPPGVPIDNAILYCIAVALLLAFHKIKNTNQHKKTPNN